MGEWSNQNYPAHLRVTNQIYWLTGTRGKPPRPRSTEVRNLKINQASILKPRLIYMASALTWKAKILTLGREHLTNFPKQLSNWSDTLEQHTVTYAIHTSWLKPQPYYSTQLCLPSLIWVPCAPKHMQRWLNSRKRTLMKTPTKIWGRMMSTNQTCTRSTISLWDKKWTTTQEGGVGRHLPDSKDWPITNRLPDDPKEDLILR